MKSSRSIFNNPYLSLLQTAWSYAKEERNRYRKIYALFTLSNIIYSLEPILWGWFIGALAKEGVAVLRYGWIYIAGYLLIRLGDWAFHGPARIMERKLAFNLSRNFLQEMYHKTLHLPVKWHQDNHSGATINRVRKAYEALMEFFENGFMYFHTLAKFLFSFGAMIYFSPLFGTLAIILGVGIFWVILKFDKPFIAAVRETNEKEHLVSAKLFDSLSNIITVITLRLEQRMEKGLLQSVDDVFPPFRRKIWINEWKWFTVEVLIGLIYSLILLGYVYQHWNPAIAFPIGGLVTLMAYVGRFTGVFQNFAWQYTQIVRYHTDVQTAGNILEAFEQHHRPDDEQRLPNHWRQIEMNRLNFRHQLEQEVLDGKVHGLTDLSMRIQRGQKIALIGESGSGKSTLLALLRGLYQPDPKLVLKIDGKDNLPISAINHSVTLFPQEPEIFENTILYNITLGLPFSEEEVQEVCKAAHFSSVAASLPKGFESNIKEKGVNLSGGQRQRLALARGILAAKDSSIVLLDEPTSSVDPKTEMLIYDHLFATFRDKAVISSLHRLHLLNKFDYVYIMDNGRIVDEGSFDALRKGSEIFQELWKHQEEMLPAS